MPRASAAVTPVLIYRDAAAALAWLEGAFGLRPVRVIADGKGGVDFAELAFGDGLVGLAAEGGPSAPHASLVSPAAGGQNSQGLWLRLSSDIDAHCEKAEAFGARIVQRPFNEFYGDRIYRALDEEGHVWCFRQEALTRPRAGASEGEIDVTAQPTGRAQR